MGAAAFTILESRSKVVDYSLPLHRDVATFCTTTLSPENLNFMAYINNVHYEAWGAIAIVIVVLSVSFAIMGIAIKKPSEDNYFWNLHNMFATICITILQRDMPIEKKNNSVKLLHLITCILGLYLFTLYSAVLTSLMTASPSSKLFHNFQGAYDNGIISSLSSEQMICQ